MAGRTTIGVIGAGAWGTALAILFNRVGNRVTLWSRNANVITAIRDHRINDSRLPGVFIDPGIEVTDDLPQACHNEILVLALPSQTLRSIAIAVSDLIDINTPLVLATKGIEKGSLMLMSEVVASIMPGNPVAVLSGPNFADEAAQGLPTATTLGCTNPVLGDRLLYALGGRSFRPYVTGDIVGTQIGGAVKNVIAIASGIATGRGMGENARAALITRGLAEMTRLCLAKGGKMETVMGLSGIGDLMLTCTSTKSRNMALGVAIGQSRKPDILSTGGGRGVTEGVATADSVSDLSQKLGVSMPICHAVRRVLMAEINVDEAISALLERPYAAEAVPA